MAANIYHHHCIPQKFCCDKLGLVRQINQANPVYPLSPEWELVEPVRTLFCAEHVKIEHVKGHQDDDKDEGQLTPLSRMNIEAHNQVAKGHDNKPTHLIPPGFGVLFFINDIPITTKYARQIRHAFTTPDIARYLKSKHHCDNHTTTLVDWNGLESTISSMSKMQQSAVTKLLHGWSFRSITTDYSQPLCKCGHQEGTTHLYHCVYNAQHVSTFIQRRNTKLKRLKTHRLLREAIIYLFRQTETQPWGDYKNHITREIEEQQNIGSDLILMENMTQTWGYIQ